MFELSQEELLAVAGGVSNGGDGGRGGRAAVAAGVATR